MFSKSQISFVKSLHQKKYRKETGLFLVEGIKSINEFISGGYSIHTIFYIDNAVSKLDKLSQKVKLEPISSNDLCKISTLTTPQQALALIHIPNKTPINPESFKDKFTLVLDGVQDPGNMGTIIRTADWFGIENVVCSPESVEVYNPKVVHATMGSLSRIKVHYIKLSQLFEEHNLPVYGAFLNGENVYQTNFGNKGFIVLGNEGNGISDELAPFITKRITIPNFGKAESLNVAISAAIFCSELKRNSL